MTPNARRALHALAWIAAVPLVIIGALAATIIATTAVNA
ncbi:Uncharacterised protein [Mycobacteroides abscessus subsp. abscessus]|nr:Uncharacterised protein [Mycobacteroides abscessus subsp. abscessus]